MRLSLMSVVLAGGFATFGGQAARAGLILDGNATFPGSAAVFTSATDGSERDLRPTTPPRNNSQSFQVGTTFQIDAIALKYEAPGGVGYVDGTFNLRIYPVADTLAASGTGAPAPSGPDLLNIPITLDAPTRTAANFTTSAVEPASTLLFDLTGVDEITLPATTGTAGYVLQFELPSSGATAGGFFTWRSATGNPYAAGRFYDATSDQSANDGTLAIIAVPEPGSAVAVLGSLGLLGLARRRRCRN